MKRRTLLGVIAAFPVLGRAAKAAERVQIGFITTLSGPAGYLGEDIRDGFLLAVKQENGGLGGAPVQVMVEDDGLKPGTAKQIVQRMLQSDHVKLFTGTVFSNVADTMLGDIIDAQAYFLGPNTSPNEYSGKLCDPHYFVTGWDETLHASAGILANVMGKKRLVVMAPNYLTGKQVIAAVKGTFKGEIVAEIYTSLDQTDFSAEIARIGRRNPTPYMNSSRVGWESISSSNSQPRVWWTVFRWWSRHHRSIRAFWPLSGMQRAICMWWRIGTGIWTIRRTNSSLQDSGQRTSGSRHNMRRTATTRRG